MTDFSLFRGAECFNKKKEQYLVGINTSKMIICGFCVAKLILFLFLSKCAINLHRTR